MNLYTMVGSGIGSLAAAALSARLAAWHDAMVAHERKIRGGRTEELCDEECPHAEAGGLWKEAVETFGARAQDLTFLRARALAGASSPGKDLVSADASVTADREHGRIVSTGKAHARRSKPFVPASRSRTASLEL